MKKRLIFCLFPAFILLLFNSLAAENKLQKVIVTIGDEKITLEDFERRVKLMPLHYQNQNMLTNKKAREDLLNQVVREKLMAKEAEAMGIDKEEEVALKIEGMINNILAQEYLKREVLNKIKIKDEEIQNYYREHGNEFIEPEKIRARHILIRVDPKATPETQRKAELKAKEVLDKIKAGEDFSKLAREISEDPNTKSKGGDLWYFARGRMTPEFEKVAFGLKIGEVGPIVRSDFGLHIIKVEDKKPERTLGFDQVRNQIETALKNKKQGFEMDNLNRRLMEKYRVIIHKDVF